MQCSTAMAALLVLATLHATEAARWPITPFSKIADEINEADKMAQELEWKVSNSTAEKDSVKWFLATAMKELTNLKKVVFNTTNEGSLGFRYETCTNRTGVKPPHWDKEICDGLTMCGLDKCGCLELGKVNCERKMGGPIPNCTYCVKENLCQWRSQSFDEAVHKDDKLAPATVEAHMYDLYQAQEKAKELTAELGACSAKCPPSSFLVKRQALSSTLAKAEVSKHSVDARAPGPAPAPGGAPAPAPAGGAGAPAGGDAKPSPREVMKGVANAIYNTSQSMDSMKTALKKDTSAFEVLEAVTGKVMEKLIKAKKDVAVMEEELKECLSAPSATHLGDQVQEAMAGGTDMAMEMISTAEEQTKEANDNVANLEQKLADCNAKC